MLKFLIIFLFITTLAWFFYQGFAGIPYALPTLATFHSITEFLHF